MFKICSTQSGNRRSSRLNHGLGMNRRQSTTSISCREILGHSWAVSRIIFKECAQEMRLSERHKLEFETTESRERWDTVAFKVGVSI